MKLKSKFPQFCHQWGERVDELLSFNPGCSRYSLEGGNEVVWPENSSRWILVKYNQVWIFTWKKCPFFLPEECIFCKSKAWGIGLNCWLHFGFPCTSVRSVRQISWNYKKHLKHEIWNIKRHLYWSMLVHAGRDFMKWLLTVEKGLSYFLATPFFNNIQQPWTTFR